MPSTSFNSDEREFLRQLHTFLIQETTHNANEISNILREVESSVSDYRFQFGIGTSFELIIRRALHNIDRQQAQRSIEEHIEAHVAASPAYSVEELTNTPIWQDVTNSLQNLQEYQERRVNELTGLPNSAAFRIPTQDIFSIAHEDGSWIEVRAAQLEPLLRLQIVHIFHPHEVPTINSELMEAVAFINDTTNTDYHRGLGVLEIIENARNYVRSRAAGVERVQAALPCQEDTLTPSEVPWTTGTTLDPSRGFDQWLTQNRELFPTDARPQQRVYPICVPTGSEIETAIAGDNILIIPVLNRTNNAVTNLELIVRYFDSPNRSEFVRNRNIIPLTVENTLRVFVPESIQSSFAIIEQVRRYINYLDNRNCERASRALIELVNLVLRLSNIEEISRNNEDNTTMPSPEEPIQIQFSQHEATMLRDMLGKAYSSIKDLHSLIPAESLRRSREETYYSTAVLELRNAYDLVKSKVRNIPPPISMRSSRISRPSSLIGEIQTSTNTYQNRMYYTSNSARADLYQQHQAINANNLLQPIDGLIQQDADSLTDQQLIHGTPGERLQPTPEDPLCRSVAGMNRLGGTIGIPVVDPTGVLVGLDTNAAIQNIEMDRREQNAVARVEQQEYERAVSMSDSIRDSFSSIFDNITQNRNTIINID